MKNKLFFCCLIILALATMPMKMAIAQKNHTAEADKKFALNKYTDAIKLYKKAYSKVKNKVEKNRILYLIGTCYYNISDMKNASMNFKRVIKAKYPEKEAYYLYGKSLKAMGTYDEAIVAFQDLKAKYPEDNRADIEIETCKLASAWVENPTRYKVEPDKKINSNNSDFAPAYFDKKYKALIFTTSRDEVVGKGDDSWTGMPFTDLFVTSQDKKGNFSTPVPLDEEGIINTEANEGACTFNSKFNTLYFTRCRKEKKKILGCEILVTEKKGNTWSEPEVIPIAPADSFSVGHPALSDDELTLYFASNIPGGYGGNDLWMVTRGKKNQAFDKAVNLGKVINTAGDEMYPTYRKVGDKEYLYFASNGHQGMGGLDIFRSELIDGEWSEPINMKSPVNSNFDDFAIIFNDDAKMLKSSNAKEMGWFSTNRKGGRGSDDLWTFHLAPMIFSLSGVVKDDSTKKLISGAEVRIEGSNGTIYVDTTDKNGFYSFDNSQIVENTTYNMTITKKDYYTEKAKETTVGLENSKNIVHDINIVPIPKKPIVLPDILYDLAKWDLKPQYEDSLNGLVTIMKENPNLVIELGSHTDTRATDEYNDTLSFKRAKSCVDYIIKQGIEADRLVAKGYGERVPRVLDANKTVVYNNKEYTFNKGTVITDDFINGLKTEGEKEAAHQLNRRTTFQILKTDYVPKVKTNAPVKATTAPTTKPNTPTNAPAPTTKPNTPTNAPAPTKTTPPANTNKPANTNTPVKIQIVNDENTKQ